MMYPDRLIAASVSIAIASSLHTQTHVYVDDDAPTGGNGLSWNSAFNDLHDAIGLAEMLGANRGEIRIAGGVYKPDRGTGDKSVAFLIPGPNYTLLGGYAGLDDLANPNARDTAAHPTTLEADLLGNDQDPDVANGWWADNSETLLVIDNPVGASVPQLTAVILDGIGFEGASVGAVRGMVSGISLSFSGCKFTGNHGGGGSVLKFKGAFVSLNTCTVIDNRSAAAAGGTEGGACDFEECTVDIQNSVFENNFYNDSAGSGNDAPGGALAIRLGQLDISDSVFQFNHAEGHGGAIYASNTSVVCVDTVFNSNSASFNPAIGDGGGIYISGGDAMIKRCEFAWNTGRRGGALYSDDLIDIYETEFWSNIASEGGAFAGPGIISNCNFANCIALKSGGALSLAAGSVVQGSVFQSNYAGSRYTSGSGGAIDIQIVQASILPVVIQNSLFTNNTANHDGGAIRDASKNSDSVLTVESCEFQSNAAENHGGALYGVANIATSLIEGNTAFLGGGVYNSDAVSTTRFIENYATNGGGGFMTDSNEAVLIQDTVFINNTSDTLNYGGDLRKDGQGELEIVRSTFVRSSQFDIDNNKANPVMLKLFAGETWIESCVIWDENWNGESNISLHSNSVAAFVHTNLRMDPSALDLADPSSIFYLGGNITANPRFFDTQAGDVRLMPGSACIDSGFTFGTQIESDSDVYGEPREPFDDPGMINIGQGAWQYLDIGATEFRGTSCFADVNGDGSLTPADFTAWIALYGQGDFAADQNRDGVLTPSDFTAWISNFTNGC